MSRRLLLAVLVLWSSAAACGGDESAQVTVLAAASLTDAFGEIATEFEEANPGIGVVMGFAGSSTLAGQILAGAPADVFAAADEPTMARLVDAGEVTIGPLRFATNRLTIVVPPGNPAGIEGLADLIRPGVVMAMCATEVPCGALAESVFTTAGLAIPPASREADVRSVLGRVEFGEADAGLVYATDALVAAGRVDEVPLPDDLAVATAYPIAVLTGTTGPAVASRFVAFVTSDRGEAILAAYGFGTP